MYDTRSKTKEKKSRKEAPKLWILIDAISQIENGITQLQIYSPKGVARPH